MWKRIVCRLLHRKYHEVGLSQMTELTEDCQIWRCQWWCPKCGHQWQIQAKINRLSEPDWDPPILVKRDFTSKGTFTGEVSNG